MRRERVSVWRRRIVMAIRVKLIWKKMIPLSMAVDASMIVDGLVDWMVGWLVGWIGLSVVE